jgi:hypothetical protein
MGDLAWLPKREGEGTFFLISTKILIKLYKAKKIVLFHVNTTT